MRYLLTALVLAAPLSSGAAPSNVCSVSDIIDCKALAKGPVDLSGTQGFPKFQDGRQIYNDLAAFQQLESPSYLKGQQPTPKQIRDLNKNATRIKERVRNFLKAGRSDVWIKKSKEPEAIELRAILLRLDSVKIRVSKEEDSQCSDGGSPEGMPNAFHLPASNTIILCPATAKQSLPWITRTIAHELGHAIGPCAMELPFFKAKSKDAVSESNCFGSEEEIEMIKNDNQYNRQLMAIMSGEVTTMVENRSVADPFVSCGMFTEAPEASVPKENRSMFGRAPQCIDSIYAAEYEAEIQEGIVRKLKSGMKDPKLAEKHERADNPQQCHSRADEHFSDSFAARFTAHVAEEDNWSKNEIRMSLMNDAVALCAAQENKAYLNPKVYPSEATRLSIALNEEVIRDRLSCVAEPNAERLCSLPSAQQPSQQSSQKPTRRSGGKHSNSTPSIQ